MKQTGFLDIPKALKEGLKLDWGGSYGDMMHFDMRNKGNGAKIDSARNRYKKLKEQESLDEYARAEKKRKEEEEKAAKAAAAKPSAPAQAPQP